MFSCFSQHLADLPAAFSGLKVAKTSTGELNFLVNALAYQNGSAYNAELAKKAPHTGRLYSNIYPRHWDTWLTKERFAVFAGTVKSNATSSLELRNLLHGLNFTVTRPETPVQPFGDSGDYDISPDGKTVAFLTKAPELPKANITASYIYLVPFDGSSEPVAINGPDSDAHDAGVLGASASPRFSPDGKKLAFAQMDEIDYESDRNKLYVVDLEKGYGSTVTASNWRGLATDWDRSVGAIVWARDSSSIYVNAEDYAISRIFNIPLDSDEDFQPKNLTGVTNTIAFSTLPNNQLLVSSSAVWTSRDFYTTDGKTTKLLFSANKVDKELAGTGPHLFSEIFFTGAAGTKLHALVVKPSNYTEGQKYPLAYIIHGGPQGVNANSWSTRWNFQVWADQGYIVVAPNPTGSTSFGEKLTDDIQNNWGGTPYEDLVLGWEYVRDNLDFVDVENGIEAGASFGGFMTNWIQGHDLGRKFKALVTHDGVSNKLADYASEELWFIQRDMNGTIWDDRENYERWNPLDHIANYSTPHFVIHNTLDYRLPESDGLALFNILQERGVPSRFLNFPDENHWVLKPKNSLFWHQSIFDWINFWSGKTKSLNDEAIGE